VTGPEGTAEPVLDRASWIRDLPRLNADQESGLADEYDASWGEIENTHRERIELFLSMLPPRGRVLDAACGTGKYAQTVLESGRTPVCVDHTASYLEKVAEKAPGVTTAEHHLHALPYREEFDGVMCVDAMEFIPPEDWPVILERFRSALRPGGWLYLTVERVPEAEVRAGHEAALRLGLPVIDEGEAIWEEPDWYYHYYPSMGRVRAWLGEEGFEIREELEGPWVDGAYAYQHVLARLL
jgi:SAM-dependent methyltransferase